MPQNASPRGRTSASSRRQPPASRLRRPVSGLPRDVRIHNGHPGLRLSRPAVVALVRLLDASAPDILASSPAVHPVGPGELSIALLTAAALARLHGSFLGDPSATDVITFSPAPAGGAPGWTGFAGEICISADAALAFAAGHRRDFSEELTLYIVHGWLHLAGHDDHQPAARQRMRAAEARALRVLRTAGAIPRFSLTAAPRR